MPGGQDVDPHAEASATAPNPTQEPTTEAGADLSVQETATPSVPPSADGADASFGAADDLALPENGHAANASPLQPSSSDPSELKAQVEKATSLPQTGDFKVLEGAELPPLDAPGDPQDGGPFLPRSAEESQVWEQRIADFEREANALGNDPRAAQLHLEIGRIYEEQLAKPRNAATSYQRAFNLDPKDPSVLHASRRLFTEVGNWAMVVQILGYEIETAPTAERKATLWAEKGAILEEKLRNAEEAQNAYKAALEAYSAEPLAVNALERLHLVRKAYQQLFDVYQRALEVTDKPQRRMPLLLASAQLAEDRLDDTSAAARLYENILEVDPNSAIALDALRRLHYQNGRFEQLVAVLKRSAEVTDDGPAAAAHLLAAARIESEKLEAVDRALHTLLGALEHTPEDLTVLREIELLYEQNDRHDEVVKVLRREAEVTTEARDRVPVLFKLGTILDEHLGEAEEAIPALEEAVALMPSYTPARQSLGRLYTKTERHSSLAELYLMEIRLEEDPSQLVAKQFKLAELYETKLADEEQAIATLQELLDKKLDYQPAQKKLERLLQQREAWGELIALYEKELTLIEDADQRLFLLGRIGMYAEDKLAQLDTAQRAYERMLDVNATHLHAIRALARIATKREAWPDVLRAYDLEVEATEDQKEVVAILHRAGAVTEEKLGDVDGAIAQYEKVLTLNPTYLPALRSVGRLYASKERFDDLVAMYGREIEVAKSDEQKVGLYFRMAEILVDKLKDDDRAAEVYEHILELDGSNLAALRGLSEIHARKNDIDKLVTVLAREAESLQDPKERASKMLRVAEIEERLDRADRAAEMYQEVLRLGHHFDDAIRALVRIYSTEGLWNALSRALKTAYDHAQDDRTKAAILVRSAEVAGDKLGNFDSAAEHLENAVQLAPEDTTILSQLERISVTRRDWRRAISVAKQLAQHESDPRLYAARQIRIAMMKETQIDPPESGADHYRLALETVPDHPVALRALEIAYLKARNWAGLAKFYHREAMVTRSPVKQASLYLRAADVAENRVQDATYAADLYDRALEVAPNSLAALRGRRRIAEAAQDAETALAMVRREGEVTADAQHARELLFQAGRIQQDQFGRVDEAIGTYEAVLKRAPSHLGAFNRLEAIYLEREAWEPMIGLLDTRARAIEEVPAQSQLYVAAGQIAQDRLHDSERAAKYYREVLSRDDKHVVALVRLGPLLFSQQNWDEATDIFHRTLAVSKEPTVLLGAFKSLGIIYQEHRQDLVKCVQSFQAALQADPGNSECLERLASVYESAEDWGSAVNVRLRLAEVEQEPKKKIKVLLELGRIYEEGLSDRKNAILANRKVMEIDPSNSEAVVRLSRLYEAEGDWQSLAEATAAYVRLLGPDEKHKAAPLHLKMADVFEHRIKDDARAINALKYALDADPANQDALLSLAKLYSKSVDMYPQAVDAHRRLLQLDPFRVESYHEMHRMYERRGEHDKAFVVAEILVFLRAQHQDEDLYYHEHKSKVAPHAAAQLTYEDHDRLVTHPNERGAIRATLEVCGAELTRLFPGDFGRFELDKADKHTSKSTLALRKLADELAAVLGAPQFDLWITKKFELGLFVENEKPPVLIVGSNVGRRIQDKDQRFLIARQLERIKGGHHLLAQLNDRDLEVLLWSVARFGNNNVSVPVDANALDAMQRQIAKVLPSRSRKFLEEAGRLLTQGPVDVVRHRSASTHTANRAGLVVTNDIEVAVRNIAKDFDVRPVFPDAAGAAETLGKVPAIRELLAYAVSEEYFKVRAKLGFSIQS
ncbi:MAG: hypothetical protein RL846_20240 [Deltaproteobacteria bacterium]